MCNTEQSREPQAAQTSHCDSEVKMDNACEYEIGPGRACGKPTNELFPDGSRQYWFCDDHLRLGAERLIGRPFKDSPKADQ
jgi:hypothetical protein